ncbi:prolyl oligopeptidase family serine peptidase [Spirosoma spitsbergense]|uniref:prolyl oligopeptidase family serine peptidase n=1 Tax=Spirosoma spitsbergense TaxID=431554 RepID=UPI00039A323E|nr:prolyl oligopeptidase family serine peptidase [Spirosoma spitsbergense]
MKSVFCWPLALLTASVLAQPAPKPTNPIARPQLTVESIMQDPKLAVGTSPSSPFWSDDSQTLYFNWNPDRAKSDSLYKVTFTRPVKGKQLTASKPLKVTPAERRNLPSPPTSGYNKTYTKRLFERDDDLFLIDLKSGKVRQLTNTVEAETDPVFSGDEQRVVFRRGGSGTNLFSIDLITGELTQLTDFHTGTKKAEPKLTDQDKFLKKDQVRLSTVLKERKEKKDEGERITKANRPDRPKEIYLDDKQLSNPQLSPDGRFVTYRLSKRAADAKTAQVPTYVTESGFTEQLTARTKVGAPASTQEFFVYDRTKDTVRAVSVKGLPGIADKMTYLKPDTSKKAKADTTKKMRAVVINGPLWSEDGKLCVVVVRSLDNKDRWIARLEPESQKLTLLDRQHDDAWVGGPGIGSANSMGNMNFLADNHTLWFQSEASGYSHIYTINVLNPGEKKQLTSGKFEVQEVLLSKDKTHFYLQTNEVHPGEQHYYKMAVTGGRNDGPLRTRLTSMTGANDVTLSPDETRMAIRYSSTTQPWELYVSEPLSATGKQSGKTQQSASSPALKLTDSQTDQFKSYPWREPTLVTIPARDGQPIYARLYKPATGATGKAVVFVHGAGYLQNAHKWWSQYFREYMFNNLLVDKGYTVLDIDYRASAGYGRDWRTGIYRFMGGKDLEDHVDAARWLVQTQGVDAKRIGVYGGSYGGFITLMAMFTTPDVFKAGAALRPVTDWAAYNHPYTANILNEPQLDSLSYNRSSPIYFAEGLKNYLLICHGMVDVNVHYQDTVRLIQRLIELRKENWEAAAYPLEDHGFVEPTSWMDEYKRILKLFEERL